MTQGKLVKERLKANFGDVLIEDLWLPFFCVSSNLTLGDYHLHQRGRLRRALQASSSLPGVMPPVIWDDGSVLVDGAVTNNLPIDVMRRLAARPGGGGGRGRGQGADSRRREAPRLLLALGADRGVAQGRAGGVAADAGATVSSLRDQASIKEACDLMVVPRIEGVELRDWKAFAPAVASGYEAMTAALGELKTPLIDLCRPRADPDEMNRHIGLTVNEGVRGGVSGGGPR